MKRHPYQASYLAFLAVLLLAADASATNVTTAHEPIVWWPASPEVETANPNIHSVTPDSTSGDQFGTLSQTFQVNADFDLRSIYLRYKNNDGFTGDLTADLTIYEVDDVVPGTLTLGTPVLTESVVFPELFNNDTSNRIASIVLDTPQTISQRDSGVTGYALQLTNFDSVDNPGATGGLAWYRTGSTSNNTYLFGAAYEDSSPINSGQREFSLALSSQLPVPEPSTLMLSALLSPLALLCRRRRV
ncbi:hypothetical protein [Adhaeretor mobilis]|uniref:PEP-CTERM protein-sorting domain-containing protein n=1 Tax=Adhaeretor mobilis TaxID=1930276 RepID=A0A517MYK5_9BACT|nr:hypothetical protein [Adhaeretor mobilis]QDS99949.1 hypothetical protein HG15A2_32830 [Adhaeretor mobilis]